MKEEQTGTAIAVLLTVCQLSAVVFVAGCTTSSTPTPDCTVDADCTGDLALCIDGVCTDVECVADADCAEGQICESGECVTPLSAYTTNAFTDDQEALHAAHADGGVSDCTVCHHEGAGFVSCLTCHDDDPNEFNSFKEVAHDQNESGDGCRSCHAAEWADNCAFCHTALTG